MTLGVKKNTARSKKPSNFNGADYVLFFLLFMPVILLFAYGEFLDTVGLVMVSVVGVTPPTIYLDSRRLGGSRKSAIGWALSSLLLWIVVVPVYIFSKRKELKRVRQQ